MCSSENVQLFCCTNYTIHSTKSHTEGCNCCLLSRFHYIAGLNQYIYTCCQQIRRYSDSFACSQMKLFAFYAHEHYDKQLVMANNPSHEALMWYCFSFCWDVKGKKNNFHNSAYCQWPDTWRPQEEISLCQEIILPKRVCLNFIVDLFVCWWQ